MTRRGELIARTRDHSFMERRQSMAQGLKLPDNVNRNVLYTCLGSPSKPVFDIAGPVALQQGDRLLLCSDGLWSSLTDEEIVYQLDQHTVSEAVPELVENALRKAGEGSDNVTAIALEWETPDGFESTRGSISTESINEGVFASTVQAGWLDSKLEDLDDAAIERSIAEINEAIRRSNARRH
jgi:serine/threonine protein phosphatase PrpC